MVRAFLLRGLAIAITLFIVAVLQLVTRENSSDLESVGDFRATRLWLPFHSNVGPVFTAAFAESSTRVEQSKVPGAPFLEATKSKGKEPTVSTSPKRVRCNKTPES